MGQATQKPNNKFLASLIPLFLLIASVLLNLFLGTEVINLKKQKTLVEENQKLVLGEFASPISVIDMENVPQQVSASNVRPTILYVFSPECYWCIKNIESFKTLSGNLYNSYRIVGVSIKNVGLADFLNKSELLIPIYHTPTVETKLAFNLYSIPQTIVLSESGEVLKIWRGAYSSERKEEIESYFKIKLPVIPLEN